MNSVHIEGEELVEKYSFQEHQKEHDSEAERVDEEPALEESSLFIQEADNTVQEAVPVAEEPVGELLKLTYASIASGESRSVHVKNLSFSVTSLDILQEFKNFGKIKNDGFFLKNGQDTGLCYAFVEFEDVLSARNAIKFLKRAIQI
ncbi:uncharacterized protein LOC111405820 isoform X2 [Olea europaea var. sylvestris]|nr:uncharacterized protein LOC111405820 isoform X2 [Olea europaea var. sylvestris]